MWDPKVNSHLQLWLRHMQLRRASEATPRDRCRPCRRHAALLLPFPQGWPSITAEAARLRQRLCRERRALESQSPPSSISGAAYANVPTAANQHHIQ